MTNIVVTGIDIGTTMTTAAIVTANRNTQTILGVKCFSHSADIFADHGKVYYQECVKKLRKVRNKQPLFQHNVALVIPDVMVMNKRVTIDPRMPLEQQRMAAMHSFVSSAALEIDELCFDYVARSGEIEVYAARKKIVEQRTALIERAGMRPIVVDMEQQALLALLSNVNSMATDIYPLLIEIKARSLTLVALNEASFYHHIPIKISPCDDALVQVMEDEIDRLKQQGELPFFNVVWFIGQKEHDDLITKTTSISGIYAIPYPLQQHWQVKGTWQAQYSHCYAKACGVALRGIKALEHHYAA